MRRFGGLVVGVLLLTGCGAGGGLASTTASAVSSAAVSSVSTTAAPTTTAVVATTTSQASSVAVATSGAPLDQNIASLMIKSLFDQNLTDANSLYCCLMSQYTMDQENERYYTLESLTAQGSPTPNNGIMEYHLLATVKSKDTGASQTWRYTVGVDRATHKVDEIATTKE